MKYIRQIGIILLVSLLGELLKFYIPLPVPASIYGLLLMLAALQFRIIPLHAVRPAGKFLIDIMPVMFVPPAVGLMNAWTDLRPVLLPVVVMMLVSTVVVMGVTGRITQWVIDRERGKQA